MSEEEKDGLSILDDGPGQAGSGPAEDEAAPGEAAGERLVAGRNRDVQVARTGGRRLFQGEVREEFLEWFAATANARWAAERAGIAYQTVWKHRMSDPAFAEAFDRALDQALVRVKAKLLETRIRAAPIPIDGNWEAPEIEIVDRDFALRLIGEHERRRAGLRKPGRAPRVASDAEVSAALRTRLAAYSRRVREMGGSAALPNEQAPVTPPPGLPSPSSDGEEE